MAADPFWKRYPEKYVYDGLFKKIRTTGFLQPIHEEWLKEDYFPIVGFISRQPRYKNKRGIDPQLKMFIDEKGITINPGWELPIPNAEAAYKSMAKYGKNEVILANEDVRKCNLGWEWMCKQFFPYMSNSRILTYEEAKSRLDMSTASGCPFNTLYPTKRELFENDPEIDAWFESDWELLAADEQWTGVYSSSLKEEIRPDEKIRENSLRTFAAGAIDLTIHGNRLFCDMNEKMYDSHLRSASTIGMSPLNGNWDKLYHKLSVFKKGFALDESQFDSSQRKFLIWGCARFRWLCLREEDRTPANLCRILTYYRNVVNSLILTADGVFVLKKLGMPSGTVSTVTDNTLILYWMMAYAWIKTAPPEYCNYAAFEDHTSKALLGDDNTWTVSETAITWYNAHSVIDAWKTLGITTTTDSMEPRNVLELDFLSAHTVFERGVAVPLYDRNKLMKSLFYSPQKDLTPEITLQRVTNLLQIGWVDHVFRQFCFDIIDWLLVKYDKVLYADPKWICAKASIKNNEQLFTLFTGSKIRYNY